MDIKVFKTFIAVAENRHFGKAAEQLYITQAAVSARIKQLEEFYSATLFIREKNNLTLTPAGEALLPYAGLIIDHVSQSKAAIDVAINQKSKLNIAATPNIWDAYVSKRVCEIANLFEGMSVGTEISVREAIQRKLEDKSLDFAFLTDPIKENEFQNNLIGYFDICLVGSSSGFSENADNYIYVDWGLTFAKEHAVHHKVFPSHRTSTATIALELILSQGGFAYLPAELVQPYVEEGSLCYIDSSVQIKRPIYLTHLVASTSQDALSHLTNLLRVTQ
ncbi:LysR family transcriptional regulator [Thalassotalea sp. LPB0316]|uniref:LysR family transcriptional regulator n=1 Tax=Thalassotalea sp. LPB0316 TaxID=2769490 RepID=UPI0018661A1F|nr:LysR family transcriptional regulator [Thalassotalea sp. LPB0316]QOL25627.1 LysR family transcriptional regulator [Thalassotalea sp. LPB0316]